METDKYVRLNTEFGPISEDWKDYCQAVLMACHKDISQAQLVVEETQGAFLLYHSDFEQPAWFVPRQGYSNVVAMTSIWALFLGKESTVAPFVETSTARESKKTTYFLSPRLHVPTDLHFGLFRSMSALIHHADELEQADVDAIFAIHRKVEGL